MKSGHYSIQGVDSLGHPWVTKGLVMAEHFKGLLEAALAHSFQQLTDGLAVYGRPGEFCSGPYTLIAMQLTVDSTTEVEH